MKTPISTRAAAGSRLLPMLIIAALLPLRAAVRRPAEDRRRRPGSTRGGPRRNATPVQEIAGAQEAKGVNETFRRELRRTIGEARDHVFPALVSIEVMTVQFGQGKELKGQSVGSGTIFSREGHVLTNAHVTSGGRKFVCTLSDQRKVPSRLVGEDPLTDLAVLQLELPAGAARRPARGPPSATRTRSRSATT